MIKGLRIGLLLVAMVVFYTCAQQAAAMVVCLPPERTVCTVLRQKEGELSFPVCLEGTTLKILSTVCYEGAFLENGSNTPVVDVLGILVENTGESHIRSAWVMLCGAGETGMFLARDLPPGSRTILLETGGAAWTKGPFFSACGSAETGEADLLATGQLEIQEESIGTVVVTNRTKQTLFDLELSYKNYLSDADIYQGGIVYRCAIGTLHPGQSVTVSPGHYAAGYSRFVYACSRQSA